MPEGKKLNPVESEVNMGVPKHQEQRWSQRREIELTVVVFCEGVRLATCRTQDVGLGGAFVCMDINKPSMDSDVDLLFKLEGHGLSPRTNRKLRAKVVRYTNEGIGLMFRDFDTSSFRTLQEIMRAIPVMA